MPLSEGGSTKSLQPSSVNPSHHCDLPARETPEPGSKQGRNCSRGTFIILLLSQEMKIILMSVIYKQGEQTKPGLQFCKLCTAWGGPGRKRWVDTGYCVWLARFLVLIELHFTSILENKFPFRPFHNEE